MSTTEAFGIHIPKLPELDKEDIKAVRAFLPGKLLGRTAALLSLALLVLGFAVPLDVALKQGLAVDLSQSPWAHYGLLFGLPILVVTLQCAVEWRAEQSRRALQRLAVRIGPAQSGYFRIGPYLDAAEDRVRFDRADRAHEKVLHWIERSASVPLYLTGDSGSGKTSLLNAAVLPALRELGWTVVEARAWQDPEKSLSDALSKLPGARRPRQGEKPALRDLIEAVARRASARLLLVLDQFEEFLILGEPREKRAFAQLLKELEATPLKGLSLMLVLRSDYQTFLEDNGLPPLRYGENFYQIGRFVFAAASDFMARSGLELQPSAIDRLLTSAAELDETPGLVRPITLNVIGYVLASGKPVLASLDAGQLIRRYIEFTVEQPAIRDFAPRVLEQLLTEQATKRSRSEEELAAATHLRHGEVRAVLNGLGSAALARPLDPAQAVWELSHDFIARAIARYLGRRPRGLLRRSAFYAAPALLAAALIVIASTLTWTRLSQDQILSELADLGVAAAPIPAAVLPGASRAGLLAVAPPAAQLTNERFAKVVQLLTKLPAFHGFAIAGSSIDSLQPLANLHELQALNLQGAHIADLEPLRNLKSLQTLDLSQTQVQYLGPLEGLTALQELLLQGTKVESLEPLRGMNQLQRLDLRGTAVTNLEPLSGLIALQQLALGATRVEDIGPLTGLTALKFLNLYETRVQNLKPLKGLIALQELDLTIRGLQNLEPIEDLPALRLLHLGGTVPEQEVIRFHQYRLEKKLPPVAVN
jgi:hypothetical protein